MTGLKVSFRPGLSRENFISSHVKITCYLHMWRDHRRYGYMINRAYVVLQLNFLEAWNSKGHHFRLYHIVIKRIFFCRPCFKVIYFSHGWLEGVLLKRAIVTIKRMCGLNWQLTPIFLAKRNCNAITRATNLPPVRVEFHVHLDNLFIRRLLVFCL